MLRSRGVMRKYPDPSRTECSYQQGEIFNAYQLAYWCQWRLAIHEACARFDDAAETPVDTRLALERIDQVRVADRNALSEEVRHLESQLGKQTSSNIKLEAALSERSEALTKSNAEKESTIIALRELKVTIATVEEVAAASTRDLQKRIASADTVCASLKARVKDAQDRHTAAREVAFLESQRCQRIQDEQDKMRQKMESLEEERGAEREYVKVVEVESLRAERNELQRRCTALEDNLANVEKFRVSKRGQALDRMEQELASEKMARVELEADRDELQTQLAAAHRANSRGNSGKFRA